MEFASLKIRQLSFDISEIYTSRDRNNQRAPPVPVPDSLPDTSASTRSDRILSIFLQEMNNRLPPRGIR